jgi:hypothetical protein
MALAPGDDRHGLNGGGTSRHRPALNCRTVTPAADSATATAPRAPLPASGPPVFTTRAGRLAPEAVS